MNSHDRNYYARMPRGQFIHFVKDILFIALDRTGSTNEFEVITSLVVEDGDLGHRATFLLSIERMYRTWGKDYYGKGKDHGYPHPFPDPKDNPHV